MERRAGLPLHMNVMPERRILKSVVSFAYGSMLDRLKQLVNSFTADKSDAVDKKLEEDAQVVESERAMDDCPQPRNDQGLAALTMEDDESRSEDSGS